MTKRRGRPRKIRHEHKEYSARDLVNLMMAYWEKTGGEPRGIFEDCKASIYEVLRVDYNDDPRIDDLGATGCTDRLYREWVERFRHQLGDLSARAA